MSYEDWVKFGAIRGVIGTLLAAFVILLTIQGSLDLTRVVIGGIIATVLVAGLYGLYAYFLSESLAKSDIKGWKALAVFSVLVGITSAVIVLAITYAPADMTAPGTAVAYSYEFTQPQVNSTAVSAIGTQFATISIDTNIPKDVITVIVSAIVGEIMVAFFTAGLYRMFGAELPEVA